MCIADTKKAIATVSLSLISVRLAQTLVLGAIAGLGNFLLLIEPGVVPILVGGGATLFALLRFGLGVATVVAMASSLPLWEHGLGVIPILEVLAVASLSHRLGWPLPKAAILFWLALGGPLACLLIWHSIPAISITALIGTLTLMLGGTANAYLAYQLTHLMPRAAKSSDETLSSHLNKRLSLLITLPLLILGFILNETLARQQGRFNSQEMRNASNRVSLVIQRVIDTHGGVIATMSEYLDQSMLDSNEKLLSILHKNYPNFISSLITDVHGVIIMAKSDIPSLNSSNVLGRSVADRDYFQRSINGELFISDVFQGRGFGADPVIAISAPIRVENGVIGILEGSLNLHLLRKSADEVLERGYSATVLDSQNRVIFSTLPNLSFLTDARKDIRLQTGRGKYAQFNLEKTHLHYTQALPQNGWKVILLRDRVADVISINIGWLLVATSMILLILVGRNWARWLSYSMTRPIGDVVERLEQIDFNKREAIAPIFSSSAISELKRLVDNFNIMVKRQYQLHTELRNTLEDRSKINAQLEDARTTLEKRVIERTAALEETKNQMEMLARAKGDFLANMSHEVRTPMTAILGFTEALRRKELSASESEKALNVIWRNGRYLLDLINDLLDHTKIEKNMLLIEMASFSPSHLITDALALLKNSATEKGLTLFWHDDASLPRFLTGDPHRLKQILLNLCTNAIKFTTDGSVTISAHFDSEKEQLLLEVKDTGIGMSQATIDSLFQPFVQAEASTARRFGGTGLGMSISKQLALLMGGDLSVDSEPGVGSCFHLLVPAKVAATAPENVTADNLSIPHLRGKVLLADDQKDNRDLLHLLIERTGASLTSVISGNEAVVAVLSGNFDVILMDIQMPEMDGVEALQLLQQSGCTTPIIALTANVSMEDKRRYSHEGFVETLGKPIQRFELYRCLSKYLLPSEVTVIPKQKQQLSDEFNRRVEILNQKFLEQLPEQIYRLKQLCETSNWEELARCAHNLKGSGGTFAQPKLSSLAHDLLKLLRAGETVQCQAIVRQIEIESELALDKRSGLE